MNLEQVIAEEIAKAKEYKAQADSGWSFLPRKRLSHLECERNKYYAERHNQIADWLRELRERKKADSREGCKNIGIWENEYENGVSCPCLRCARRAKDNYEPRKEN